MFFMGVQRNYSNNRNVNVVTLTTDCAMTAVVVDKQATEKGVKCKANYFADNDINL
jgi:hypothetical protein